MVPGWLNQTNQTRLPKEPNYHLLGWVGVEAKTLSDNSHLLLEPKWPSRRESPPTIQTSNNLSLSQSHASLDLQDKFNEVHHPAHRQRFFTKWLEVQVWYQVGSIKPTKQDFQRSPTTTSLQARSFALRTGDRALGLEGVVA